MTPIAILEVEHRLIENILDALEGFVASLGSPRSGPRVIATRERPREAEWESMESSNELFSFVELLGELVDRCHDVKEVELLYPALIASGVPERPLEHMKNEHGDGRRLLRELREAAMHADPWDAELVRRVRTAAHEYTTLMRAHIRREEAVMFRLAETRLDEATMASLRHAFAAHADREHATHQRTLERAQALLERYGGDNDALGMTA